MLVRVPLKGLLPVCLFSRTAGVNQQREEGLKEEREEKAVTSLICSGVASLETPKNS